MLSFRVKLTSGRSSGSRRNFRFVFRLTSQKYVKVLDNRPSLIVILRSIVNAMGLAKIDEFTLLENRIAKYAKALGHPARVAILRLLLKRQACVCGDIVDELPLSQSTVSQHLKELKNAGLIKGEIEGVRTCYCIDEAEWDKAKKCLVELMQTPLTTTRCC